MVQPEIGTEEPRELQAALERLANAINVLNQIRVDNDRAFAILAQQAISGGGTEFAGLFAPDVAEASIEEFTVKDARRLVNEAMPVLEADFVSRGMAFHAEEVRLFYAQELLEPITFGSRSTRNSAALDDWEQVVLGRVFQQNGIIRAFPGRPFRGQQMAALRNSLEAAGVIDAELANALRLPGAAPPELRDEALAFNTAWEANYDEIMAVPTALAVADGNTSERLPKPQDLTATFVDHFGDPGSAQNEQFQEGLARGESQFSPLIESQLADRRADLRVRQREGIGIDPKTGTVLPERLVDIALADAGIVVPGSIHAQSPPDERALFQSRKDLVEEMKVLSAKIRSDNPELDARQVADRVQATLQREVGSFVDPEKATPSDSPFRSRVAENTERFVAQDKAEADADAAAARDPKDGTALLSDMGENPSDFTDDQKTQITRAIKTMGATDARAAFGPELLAQMKNEKVNRDFLKTGPEQQARTLERMLMRQFGIGSFSDPLFQEHISENVIPKLLPAFRATIERDPGTTDMTDVAKRIIEVFRPTRIAQPEFLEDTSEVEILRAARDFPRRQAVQDIFANQERAALALTPGDLSATGGVIGTDPAANALVSPLTARALALRGASQPAAGAFVSAFDPFADPTQQEINRFAFEHSGGDVDKQEFLLRRLTELLPEFGKEASGIVRTERAEQADRFAEGATRLTDEQQLHHAQALAGRQRPVSFTELAGRRIGSLSDEFSITPTFLRRQQREAQQLATGQERAEQQRIQVEQREAERVAQEQDETFQRSLRRPRVRIS